MGFPFLPRGAVPMHAVVVSLSVIVPRAAAFGFVLQLVFAVGFGFLGVCPRLVFRCLSAVLAFVLCPRSLALGGWLCCGNR